MNIIKIFLPHNWKRKQKKHLKIKQQLIIPSKHTSIGLSRREIINILEPHPWFSKYNQKESKKCIEKLIKANKYLLNCKQPQYHNSYNKTIIITSQPSSRQYTLYSILLEYLAKDVYENLSKVFHEICDFIDDYANKVDDINYTEFLLFETIIQITLKKLLIELEDNENFADLDIAKYIR